MSRFVIYGAGGIGSLLGSDLARSGEQVLLVGRPEHVAQINASGLRIVKPDGAVEIVHVPATAGPPEPGPDDIIILTVKSYDTRTALSELRQRYDRETPIVCLQNGVRNEAAARRVFRRVYGGLNVIGAQYLTPGVVEELGVKTIAIGVYPRGTDALAELIVEAAQRAGLKASVHPNVMAAKWTKLVSNLHNAVFALCNATVAETYGDPDGWELVRLLRNEALAVLKAANIDHEPVAEIAPRGSMPQLRVPMYGSTWMDFKRRRGKQEADSFNGEIVRLGRRHGIPTPANEVVLRLTRLAARKNLPPGGHRFADLRAAAERGAAVAVR